MKQESAMHNKRDVSAKGARAKVEAAKNIKKGMSYTLAFALINDALKCKCHLQAIAVEESILADRLASALYFGEKAEAESLDKDTLGRILKIGRMGATNGNAALNSWREEGSAWMIVLANSMIACCPGGKHGMNCCTA